MLPRCSAKCYPPSRTRDAGCWLGGVARTRPVRPAAERGAAAELRARRCRSMRGAILSGRSHADFHCLSQKNSKIYGEREPFRPHTPQQEQAPHPRISGNGPYGGLYVCRMCVIPAASSRIPGPIWPEISANDAVALRGLIVTGARRVCGCASGRSVNPGGTQVALAARLATRYCTCCLLLAAHRTSSRRRS